MTDLSRVNHSGENLFLELAEAGFFEITDRGHIYRTAVTWKQELRLHTPRRAEYESSNGYLRVRLTVDGVRLRVSAHRLVYRYFKGIIPAGHVVNHIDRDRKNNAPQNLEAVTQSQNVRHALGLDY